jgi:alpha-tubulin suppressor-like RCC1 family protein
MLTAHVPVGHFDPPSEKVPELTPRLDEVVLQALNAEPDQRFATMTEVKDRLRDAIAHPGLTRPERRRQLGRRALMASLAAAALGAGGVWLWSALDGALRKVPASPESRPDRALLANGRLAVFGTVPCPLANERVSAVALGGGLNAFGLALLPGGTVRAWGDNRFGQTNVPPELRDVIALAAGQGDRSAHALALRADGTVIGWGDNTFGQAASPPGLAGVVAIAAGEMHSLALTREGRVVAWGNITGPAGAVPENLPPGKAIAAGATFNLELLNDGRVIAWGLDDAGQCQVPQMASTVASIAAGSRHALARLADGTVIAWGDNSARQCEVPADLASAVAVFAGGEGSAALDSSGAFRPWGLVPGGAAGVTGRVAQAAMGSSVWAVIESAFGDDGVLEP